MRLVEWKHKFYLKPTTFSSHAGHKKYFTFWYRYYYIFQRKIFLLLLFFPIISIIIQFLIVFVMFIRVFRLQRKTLLLFYCFSVFIIIIFIFIFLFKTMMNVQSNTYIHLIRVMYTTRLINLCLIIRVMLFPILPVWTFFDTAPRFNASKIVFST